MALRSLPVGVRPLILASSMWALGIGLVLPLTLIYLHSVRHLPLRTTGVLLAIPGVIALVAIPVAGTLVDRVGARWVLAGTLILIAVAQAILAVARTATIAAVALLVLGLAEGPAFPAFNTLLAERAPGAVQQRAFGLNFTLFNAAIGLGALIGAMFADVHRTASFQAMFAGSALGTLIGAVLIAAIPGPAVDAPVPAPAPPPERAAGEGPTTPPGPGGYREVVADPLRRQMFLLCLALAMCGYGALESGLPAYANVVAKLPVRVVAVSLAVDTLVIVMAQLFVLRYLRGRRRSAALATVGVVWCVSWLVFGTAALPGSASARTALVMVFAVIFGLGETFMAPTMTPLVTALVPEELLGRANAISSGMFAFAFLVSPAIVTGFIAVGLAGVWIVLLALGALSVTLIARTLGRKLGTDQDIGEPELPPEPVPEPSAY
jgi:MFS family permease